jgi:hypothetical protein
VKVYNENGMAQGNGTGMFPREVVQKPPGGFCQAKDRASGARDGPFAMDRCPLLPLEEEGRLNDMPLRENFIERIFGLRRKAWLSAWQFAASAANCTTAWTEMLKERTGTPSRSASPLVRFHTAHKLTLMAHSPS